ncbi:MAG: glycosyltransferase family 1 protein [Caldilineaceae bacterium]|nr:glycosyltransferase family 1 protein [Caldilineaceae bacterium]
MRLLFINKIETNAGWGFETHLNAALQKVGIETISLDYHKHRYGIAKHLLERQEDFDGVLVERGTGYAIPASVLQAIRCPRFLLFTELVSRHPDQHYLLRENLFDYVFLRSAACIDFVRAKDWLRAEQVGLFLSAVDPGSYHPVEGLEQDIDVLFVGTLTPRRELLLAELQRDFSVTVASAFAQEMATLVNRAKIVLNLHAEEYLDTETRVYETLACGGFLITEPLSRESPFTSGIHLIEAGDSAALWREIAYYLTYPDERRLIANTGRAKVIAEHTIDERARQLHAIFSRFITKSQGIDPLDRALLRRAVAIEAISRMRDLSFRLLARLKRGYTRLTRLSPVRYLSAGRRAKM